MLYFYLERAALGRLGSAWILSNCIIFQDNESSEIRFTCAHILPYMRFLQNHICFQVVVFLPVYTPTDSLYLSL